MERKLVPFNNNQRFNLQKLYRGDILIQTKLRRRNYMLLFVISYSEV